MSKKELIRDLEQNIESLSHENRSLRRDCDRIVEDKNREISLLQKELKLKNDTNEQVINLAVMEKTGELTARNTELHIQNCKFESENKILTKAFENLGFDVKDMKEILNKLVDGLVSKNAVHIVK